MSEKLEPIYKRIADKIVAGRKFQNITQKDLAEACAMSRPALANIEAGRQRVSIHDIQNICRAIGISPDAFMKDLWR